MILRSVTGVLLSCREIETTIKRKEAGKKYLHRKVKMGVDGRDDDSSLGVRGILDHVA